MTENDVEKAWRKWAEVNDHFSPLSLDAFAAGAASRDAEVAELQAAFADSDAVAKVNAMNAGDWLAMQERVAELEAVIEKAREAAQPTPYGEPLRERVLAVLDAAPSSVLAEHDADKWDEGWRAAEHAARIEAFSSFTDVIEFDTTNNPYRALGEVH